MCSFHFFSAKNNTKLLTYPVIIVIDKLKDQIEEIKATQNDPLLSKLMIFFCKEIDLPLEQFTDQEREVVEGLFKRCRRYEKEVSLLGKKGRKR